MGDYMERIGFSHLSHEDIHPLFCSIVFEGFIVLKIHVDPVYQVASHKFHHLLTALHSIQPISRWKLTGPKGTYQQLH